ncbi:241_t:CDS:1 [Paraglomus brasilianum]|uniref:241_t:CDS:1 n=1 Tax=Paraglomus brasilianum TaxID=144538 RepID=A0A9N9ALY9_9GLOM|nr:241_t:CDS:1 [Paraglomus brasilianum]
MSYSTIIPIDERTSKPSCTQSFPPVQNIKLPSPSDLPVESFLPKKRGRSRTSNAFMIYRKLYFKALAERGCKSKMIDVSRWASAAWAKERVEVKMEFNQFANRLENLYHERLRNAELSSAEEELAACNKTSDNSSQESIVDSSLGRASNGTIDAVTTTPGYIISENDYSTVYSNAIIVNTDANNTQPGHYPWFAYPYVVSSDGQYYSTFQNDPFGSPLARYDDNTFFLPLEGEDLRENGYSNNGISY